MMMSFSLFLLVPCAIIVVAGEKPAGSISCFDEDNPPSCFLGDDNETPPPAMIADDSINAQEICFQLDYKYLYGNQFELSKHVGALSDIPADSELCNQIRQVYHTCFWCTPNITDDRYCFFDTCDQEEPEFTIDESVDVQATCEEMAALLEREEWPSTIDLCYRAEQVKHICSDYCEYEVDYLGADTTKKKRALIWVSRSAAILTFLGASYILWDVLSHRKNRATVYHQLLACMSCFDICTAVAWSFATAPIPKDEGWYIEGAKGNDKTCTAQGFFIQLGYTSVFYNVSLALYYVLVIVYSLRETALKKIRPYLHGPPLLLGFGLAFGGIPVYDWIEYSCHLLPPTGQTGEPLWKVLIFAVLPISSSIGCITLAMICVYVSIRRKSQAGQKWSLGFGKTKSLEQRVFWQAFLYTISFYITWPIILTVYLSSVDTRIENFAFTMLVAFVGPLQGFNNFLVYIRPKIMKKENLTRASQLVKSLLFQRSFETASTATEGNSDAVVSSASSVDFQASLELPSNNAASGSSTMPSWEYEDPSVLISLREDYFKNMNLPDVVHENDEEGDDDDGKVDRRTEETKSCD